MRNRFDVELDNMNSKLVKMGNLCSEAIYDAAMALKNGNESLAKQVVKEDEEVDQMEKEIESTCLKLLLQQQPVAKDLRQISAALKMITDMERIGDQAADIAEIVLSGKITEAREMVKIQVMAEKASDMVKNSIKAFVRRDLELTRQVIEADEEVDALFEEIRDNLINMIVENKEDSKLAIDLIMITKYLERIGDHATNVAEWVEFSITGVHSNQNN